ncbi:uncharacterized protein E5676_scaffold255G003480 [Cucumis melo var. makuwa]|uniref:Uncharacterized protein n=2 Tax=Cucumis melo TaxID=3656 RepID=A0A5D3CMV2_CUCMM|nr:uncharacterized protein E6C27_scaffold18G001650 [Cucumis melo var. makuwa]TYK12760.1 uncharacterized protein E5676_scaffold255G003480 [Cucumis melo var. makuwa]
MPIANSIASSVDIKTLRRSPRFLASTEQQEVPTTRRSLRFLRKNEISSPTTPTFRRALSPIRQVHSSHASLEPSNDVSLKTPKSVRVNTPKRASKSGVVSSKNKGSSTGSKKYSIFENVFEEKWAPRRSPRLSCAPKIDNALEGRNTKVSKSSISSGGWLNDLKNPSPNVRRSPRFSNGVGGNRSIGKSHSFSGQQAGLEKSSRKRENHTGSRRTTGSLRDLNVDASVSSHGEKVAAGERQRGNSADREDIATKAEGTQVVDGEMEKKSVGTRKRKREDGVVGIRQGWTKEQEVALQRAYYVAKPTPQFWKKVSKLVPGKSAQDCFDKVHSDHMTPPQPRPRFRTRSTKSSPTELLFSEGELLNLDGAKSRKPSRKSQKSHNAQKAVRYLLEKNFQGAINYEADLFSQLEPNINLSNHTPLPSKQLSSMIDLQGNQGFLHGRSLSNHKKPLSRFSTSVERVVSPPVLKQVKNRVLHEKYIDQLHCREAKRKSMSKCRKSCISKEEGSKGIHTTRTNDLRAAKNALISDARDAIQQFQHLEANATNNIPDFEDGEDFCYNVDYDNEDDP